MVRGFSSTDTQHQSYSVHNIPPSQATDASLTRYVRNTRVSGFLNTDTPPPRKDERFCGYDQHVIVILMLGPCMHSSIVGHGIAAVSIKSIKRSGVVMNLSLLVLLVAFHISAQLTSRCSARRRSHAKCRLQLDCCVETPQRSASSQD